MPERVLSIFCDESGDFGPLEQHSPYYLVTFVFHEQMEQISGAISNLEQSLADEGRNRGESIHTGPLIRREAPYEFADLKTRRRLFSHIEHLMRVCPVKTKTFVVDKRIFGSSDDLAERLAKDMGSFIRDHLEYFQSFERVVLYYDHGQRELNGTLRLILSANLTKVEFRTVSPIDYRLFQVADLVCTLELLAIKLETHSLSTSEITFFRNPRSLKKDHLKALQRKRF